MKYLPNFFDRRRAPRLARELVRRLLALTRLRGTLTPLRGPVPSERRAVNGFMFAYHPYFHSGQLSML